MMKAPYQVIELLEADNSRLAKEKILETEMRAQNDELFEGIKLALDPLVTFGVKSVDVKTEQAGTGLEWNSFRILADQLISRKLTGNAARSAIESAMNQATTEQWNGFYRRILIKDLRCGTSEKTINKVAKKYPKYSVPVFSCMLAQDSADHASKMQGLKQVEIKLDGCRVLTVISDTKGERVEMFSRNGKQYHNFGHIIDQIKSCLQRNEIDYPVVLDGEIMSSSFQDLMKQVHRKENAQTDDAILYLFDMVPLTSFVEGECRTPQDQRSEKVRAWVKHNQDVLPSVRALDSVTVDLSTPAGRIAFKELNEKAIQEGYEGLLIKDHIGYYQCKRSSNWLKLKPVLSFDLTITQVLEGTGKFQGKMGSFECQGTDNGRFITVNVGSGFTDDQRDTFWDIRSSLIGKMVEVYADAVTQNQDQTYSLRFPRFKTFRDDKQM